MPSKKKKYNARFPAGRIKKIMQTDEEVGKVAQAVPVIISRTLELFVESLLLRAMEITSAKNAKTLTPSHMKQCILSDQRFDFLKDLVKSVADTTNGEDDSSSSLSTGFLSPSSNKVAPERRKSNSTVVKEDSDKEDEEEMRIDEPPTDNVDHVKEEPSVHIKGEPVPVICSVKKEPLSHPVPVIANCSTLRLNPNFYMETNPEEKVQSIHSPPVVPVFQQPAYAHLPRISQIHQPPGGQVPVPAVYPEPQQAGAKPASILVMDEDYDT